MSDRNQLVFWWNYVPLLSPEPVESDPELRFFLSTHVDQAQPLVETVRIGGSERHRQIAKTNEQVTQKDPSVFEHGDYLLKLPSDANVRNSGEAVKFKRGGEPVGMAPEYYAPENLSVQRFSFASRLPRDATLNVDAFAWTYNNKGEQCLAEAGSTSLYLEELYQHTMAHDIIVQKTLKFYNAGGLVKGLMVFVFHRDFLTSARGVGNRLPFDEAFAASTVYDYIGANKELFSEAFKKYIVSNYEVFAEQNSQPTWKFGHNIHSPMYSFRGITMPGLGFTMLYSKNARNPEAYYENLLQITLRRHYKEMSLRQSVAYFEEKASDQEVAVVLAELVTVFSNYCNYMTDKAHTLERKNRQNVQASDHLYYVEYENARSSKSTMRDSVSDRDSTHSFHQRKCEKENYYARKAQDLVDAIVEAIGDESVRAFDEYSSAHLEQLCAALNNDSDSDDGDGGEEEESEGFTVESAGTREHSVLEQFLASDSDDDGEHYDRQYEQAKKQIEASMAANRHPTRKTHNVSKRQATRINDSRYVKLIESFSVWLRYTKTGDCEDLAREILRHLWDIKQSEFASKALQRLQRVRREYIPWQTLKGVSSSAITDDLDNAKKMGAHMDITLLPGTYALQLMRNFNSSPELFEGGLPTFLRFPERAGSDALPTLICEGTGCLKPDGSPDTSFAAKLYLMRGSGSAFANVKNMLHQPIKERSSFYKMIQSALVHEFIAEGYGIGEVVFFRKQTSVDVPVASELQCHTIDVRDYSAIAKNARLGENDNDSKVLSEAADLQSGEQLRALAETLGERRAHGHAVIACDRHPVSVERLLKDKGDNKEEIGSALNATEIGGRLSSAVPSYGILHTALVNQRTDGIAMYTMPDVTEDEVRRMERVLAHNQPLEPLTAPQYSTLELEERRDELGNVLLEQLKAVARRHGEKRREHFSDTLKSYVDFYYKYHQVTESRIAALKTLFKQKRFLLDVEYFEEPITGDGLGGYLVRFTCVKLKAVRRK